MSRRRNARGTPGRTRRRRRFRTDRCDLAWRRRSQAFSRPRPDPGGMQSDYFYPDLADRRTPQDWADQGAPDLLEQARLKTRELQAETPPQHIPAEVDADIRRRFPIRL